MMTESIRNDMVAPAKHTSVCEKQPSRGAARVTTALIHVHMYSIQTWNCGRVHYVNSGLILEANLNLAVRLCCQVRAVS